MAGDGRRRLAAYVENDAGMAADNWSAAWSFDLPLWGVCGQGVDESAAVADLRRRALTHTGVAYDPYVVERVRAAASGGEPAFARDHRPCTDGERAATLAILARTRAETVRLVSSCPDSVLDWADPDRTLPAYAGWHSVRQLAWHVVDCESRYYLPRTGLGYREPAADLLGELVASGLHVRAAVASMAADLARTTDGERWTSVKLLRRLAWHERGELEVMRDLVARAPR